MRIYIFRRVYRYMYVFIDIVATRAYSEDFLIYLCGAMCVFYIQVLHQKTSHILVCIIQFVLDVVFFYRSYKLL